VVIGVDRAAAAERAAGEGADIVICDDGLQHLRLARDYEIAVVDAVRGLGNCRLLPAGPLREPPGRIESVDAVILARRDLGPETALHPRRPFVASARFVTGDAVNLRSGERRTLASFAGPPLHAVAAIGHPEAFFAALRAQGLEVVGHALPDHAALEPQALPFPAGATVLMTEKDAVKCTGYAQPGWWHVELDVAFERGTARDLIALVLERAGLTGAGVKLG
jgi:tetraacyldisaccharide 4'-kinase